MNRIALARAGAALAASRLLPSPVSAAPIEWKGAFQFAPDHPVSVRLTQMWDAIRTESGGRLRATLYPNSQLGSDAAMLTQLRLGAVHFVTLSPGILASVVPVADIGFLGFAFQDATEGLRVMNGPLGTYIRDETARKGPHVLSPIWDGGMIQMSSSLRPIRTPRDLTGSKMRVAESPILSGLFKALGANPVPLPSGELYTALQTKTVDGEAGTIVTMETTHAYEVQRYISLTNHAWSSLWIVLNGDAWNALPADLQAIVQRANLKYAKLQWRDMAILNGSLADKMRRRGVAVNAVDQQPFRRLLRAYYDTWSNAFGTTAWGLLQNSLGHAIG